MAEAVVSTRRSSARRSSGSISYISELRINDKSWDNPFPWKRSINKILSSWLYTTFMMILTFYSLFGDDLRVAVTRKSADDAFFGITSCVIFFFALEIILSSIAKEGYICSFFFWLDITITLLLFSDIGWIWDVVAGSSSDANRHGDEASQIARTGRISRVERIIRIVRLIRIIKLCRFAQTKVDVSDDKDGLKRAVVTFRGKFEPIAKIATTAGVIHEPEIDSNGVSPSQSFSSIIQQSEPVEEEKDQISSMLSSNFSGKSESEEKSEENSNLEDSKLGQKLTELTIKRLITFVLGMILLMPLFYTSTYLDENNSFEYGLEFTYRLVGTDRFEEALNSYVENHKDLWTPLIYLDINGNRQWGNEEDVENLREMEKRKYVFEHFHRESNTKYISLATIDISNSTKLEAGLSILRTCFICIVLAVSSVLLSKDARVMILEPIENMVETIKNLSNYPLSEAYPSESQNSSLPLAKNSNETEETRFMQESLKKISGLLSLVFGEAGCEIIAHNMASNKGDINPKLTGKRAHCIFGYCKVHYFSYATEVFQEDASIFLNEIASIVHSIVDQFSGSVNKNIADAFLLVWKFPESSSGDREDDVELRNTQVTQFADMAVMSFIKILIEIHKSYKINKFKRQLETDERMAGFNYKIGVGLHKGWAIEGAVGSEFKIDPTYISPNIDMATNLESATIKYEVPIIISGSVQSICSATTKSKLRKIDRVLYSNFQEPVELYTCDLDFSLIRENEQINQICKKSKTVNHMLRESQKQKSISGEYPISNLFTDDEDIILSRHNLPNGFLKTYSKALNSFAKGKWDEAKIGFLEAQTLKNTQDGPCKALLEFMEKLKGEVPFNWKGFRELNRYTFI